MRRPVALVCAACYLVAWTGIPLPAQVQIAADSAPFPCQGHHCGCTSAEQCWTNCCCMTPAQRLAWAPEHGVQPPASVLAELAHESDATESEENVEAEPACDGHCCCSAKPKDATCCENTPRVPSEAAPDDTTRSVMGTSDGTTWVSHIAAQRCRGATTEWIASGAVLIVVAVVEIRPDAAVTWLASPAPSMADSPPHAPAVPPPRLLAA